MKYVDRSFFGCHLQRLLGIYELELHTVIEQTCRIGVARVIDIGAAEGYYAVGFAIRLRSVDVVAYEIVPDARDACSELAAINRLSERVTVCGLCEPADLNAVTASGIPLVICDIKGAEDDLLDPSRVPNLIRAYLLVETHDSPVRA